MAHGALGLVLVGLAVLLAAAVLCGQAARRLGAPAIVGELLAGVALGPTLLGRLNPQLQASLFPMTGPQAAPRQMLVTAGLLGFLFVAGLEMDLSRLHGRLRLVIGASACGLAVPFALGAAAVLAVPSFFGGPRSVLTTALFIGTALSISALPVIARVLMDLGVYGSAFASLVLSVAVIDDLVGWSLFALLSRRITGEPGAEVGFALAGLAALVVLSLTVGRTLVMRLRPWVRRHLPEVPPRLAVAAALTFGAAGLVESVGVHAVLGGFLVGTVLSQGGRRDETHEICQAFATGVLAPLYFTSIGLRADFLAHLDLGLTLLVVAIACAGKIGAAALAGRALGLPARDALALGAALNARGAMEILLAGVALEQGLIDERLFVALVVMAVVTSLMSAPLLRPLVKRSAPVGAGRPAIPVTVS